MAKKSAGLGFDEKTQCWIIDKFVKGKRIYERTKYSRSERAEAERRLNYLSEQIYEQSLYGMRPKRIFRDAAVRYCMENKKLRTIDWVKDQLKRLDPYIGDEDLDKVHRDCAGLQNLLAELREGDRKNATLNGYLGLVRRILNKAAYEWRDENNLTWLDKAPRIRLLATTDARAPEPINWNQQAALLKSLAPHLADISLFIINTGARSNEVMQLQWEWEVKVSAGLAFLLPESVVKGDTVGERLLICNDVAASVVNKLRGIHPTHVFTYTERGKLKTPQPIIYLNNNGWRNGCKKAGVPGLHIHDLRHTFGFRLRQAGVDSQTRSELLGHSTSNITEHYSMGDLTSLYQDANKIIKPSAAETVVSLKRRKVNLVR